jgi:hypothetical protein
MDIKELKILLKLLGKTNHRAPLGQVKPNEKTGSAETRQLCTQLLNRTYIESKEEIKKIKITSAGKTLLKLPREQNPLTTQEWKLLEALKEGAIAPSKISIKPAATRDELIRKAVERGLLEIAEKEIKEIWLTEVGKKFLAEEYLPSGAGNLNLSKKMLGDYLHFIRKYPLKEGEKITPSRESVNLPKPTDEQILEIIKNLDYEFGTDNYLPIFYLREKLQPPLSRKELDDALFMLQRQDKIEISSLVNAELYTTEQVRAGISQTIGGPLFFLIVN